MHTKYQLKHLARIVLVPLLYRYPPSALQPERLYFLLHHLIETQKVAGAVVEVGCNLGGTTVIAKRLLQNLGVNKRYICIDTFDGFLDGQFNNDVNLGTPVDDRHHFSGNSKHLVSKILRQHGCDKVEIVEGDIITLPEQRLPAECSLVSADVDLSEPTYVALQRFWPRLARGGIILVDDCPADTTWKARLGYARFCHDAGLPERYQFGMGIVTR